MAPNKLPSMGFAKRQIEAQVEYGFFTSRAFELVCEHCIEDEDLARFASRLGPIGTCTFCGRNEVLGTDVGTLFRYMSCCLRAEWDDPLNEVGWDQGWDPFVTILDSDDLLSDLDDPLRHPDLRTLFVTSFDHNWCQRGPYRLEHSTMLTLSWEHFAKSVRTRHRYLFLRRGTDHEDDELVPPADMLDAIAQAIHNAPHRMLTKLATGTPLIRARVHDPGEVITSAENLGSPPPGSARANRMSPVGIPMFYATDSSEAALAEVRPTDGQVVTWGEFTTTRDLWCLDLTQARPIPSIFDPSGSISRTWLRFLANFSDEVSKPAGVSPEIDYIPTQVVTEYVRDVLRSSTGEPIMAIKYSSAALLGAVCWVFFVGPEGCGDLDVARSTDLLLLDRASLSSRNL